MADEGLIGHDEALMRIEPEQLNQLLRPVFGAADKQEAVKQGRIKAKGLPAGPGAATGRVVFNAQDAVAWAARGEKVLLVRDFTSPDDIRGMDAAQGILTAQGGMTSHAALVARQMGKVCIVGCGALDIDMRARSFAVDDVTVSEGDWISIDGFTGEVILGELDPSPPEVLQVLLDGTMKPEESESFRYYREVMEWADAARKLRVRTNADQPDQSENAIAFGAEGIGLCRTEHMFFEGDRILSVREMILSGSREEREAALAKLEPMQRDDFAAIFRVMAGRHVTIRTLDPPLHEFLPHDAEDTARTAAALGVSEDEVRSKVEDLHENNPMLGHRGCRLGIAFPEITAMQARAILEAACLVKKEGNDVHPEIMIPLVGTKKELEHQAAIVREVADEVFSEQGTTVDYLVGTMIEIPRAALTANEIAEVAEFFSFGTNDLTQMTLGVSRDDAGKFLPLYTSEALEIWPADPFATLDQSGVGQLVELGIERGRATRRDLHVGICGEQGGDPETVKFCHRAGMDYVSCSPFRLPVARLAAAQAAIEESGDLRLEK
jgi:pyruvate,orthophosphate dikinase